jgi:hypothetical protein
LLVVERVVQRSKKEPRPSTPLEPRNEPLKPKKDAQDVRRLTPRANSPIELVSSPKIPVVEKKIIEAASNVEGIDEDFWENLCMNDEDSILEELLEPPLPMFPVEEGYRPSGYSNYGERNLQIFETSQGREAFVNYGSIVEDSLDVYRFEEEDDDEEVEDSILDYDESGGDCRNISNLFQYRAHRLYSDS